MCLALWSEACWFLGCQTGICITQTVPQPNLFEHSQMPSIAWFFAHIDKAAQSFLFKIV